MVQEVLLHIGAHKTGSTSIQETLAHYDDGDTVYARFQQNNHSHAINVIFSKNFLNYHLWKKQNLSDDDIRRKRKIDQTLLEMFLDDKSRRRLIISAEEVFTLPFDEITDLINFLRRNERKLKVVCYIRNPVTFPPSHFQEQIKAGDITGAFNVNYRVRQRLEHFRTLLSESELSVRAFEIPQLKNGCVVEDFCAKENLHPPAIKRVNTSLKAPAIKLLYHLNQSQAFIPDRKFHFETLSNLTYILHAAYRNERPLDPALFHDLADYSDIQYLQSTFNLTFEQQPPQKPKISLLEELDNLADVSIEPMLPYFAHFKFSPSPDSSLTDKIEDFFQFLLETVVTPELEKQAPAQSPELGAI